MYNTTVLSELIRLIRLEQSEAAEVRKVIQLNYRDPRPIYEQVKDSFRQLILSGVMRPEEKMPSVRELASGLAINPNTIQRAYRELEQEGYICSVPGKGSFVSAAEDAAKAHRRELLQQLKELSGKLAAAGIDRQTQIEMIRGGFEDD